MLVLMLTKGFDLLLLGLTRVLKGLLLLLKRTLILLIHRRNWNIFSGFALQVRTCPCLTLNSLLKRLTWRRLLTKRILLLVLLLKMLLHAELLLVLHDIIITSDHWR